MGEFVDKVVALSGTVRVEGHKRTTKTGKVVDVDAYTRSLRMMSSDELFAEAGKVTNRAKSAQITNELRRRLSGGKQEPKSSILNRSTAPPAAGNIAMERKTDAELRVMSVDANLREKDRKFAQAELRYRGIK